MPRIQIDLPEHFAFSTEITLYLSHMNYAGHLDNALLLSVVSEARARFFMSLGYTELMSRDSASSSPTRRCSTGPRLFTAR
jgi:acyl-CoA thioester hydrolase